MSLDVPHHMSRVSFKSSCSRARSASRGFKIHEVVLLSFVSISRTRFVCFSKDASTAASSIDVKSCSANVASISSFVAGISIVFAEVALRQAL